jgi:glucose/arabinose dehydrogenase
MHKHRIPPFISIPLILLLDSCAPATRNLPLGDIQLPPGFTIALYAENVPGARSLTLGDNNIVFVGSRPEGRVYALVDADRDNIAERVVTIARGLDSPNGVAYHDGSLYVAEINRILRYDHIIRDLDSPPQPMVVNDSFPHDQMHGWKFIAFGPDGRLYVPMGAPFNIGIPDERHANIMRMNIDGSELEVFARGVRNTVGFDWHPVTHELWFTDNGRDWMGDDLPPDELNRAPSAGLHFGYPYIHGKNIPDPKFGSQGMPPNFTPPVQELGPHVAALGMRFYTGSMFPTEYRNQIFIAEHGSWNRSIPLGYRIMLVKLDGNTTTSYTVFAEGWHGRESAWGRPVDMLVMPDGALLVSDDKAGAVYRISYKG